MSTCRSESPLPRVGTLSWRVLGFSAIALHHVRSGLALEGRTCQNRSPLFFWAAWPPRWVRRCCHRDAAHHMALDCGQLLLALVWSVRKKPLQSVITSSKVRVFMGWRRGGQPNVSVHGSRDRLNRMKGHSRARRAYQEALGATHTFFTF